jgi:IclR family transcriptional regulator, KDG regulon repressor
VGNGKTGTLSKALQVIELLSTNPRGLALTDMSKTLGFPKSTIHHMLQTLLLNDYVSQENETKRYSLGLRFLEISSRILESFDMRERAKKYLVQLHEKCHEVVQLYLLRNGKIVCVDKIGSAAGGLSISSYVGWSTEPHASAAGKVLLSGLTDEEIMEIYPDGALTPYGKNTIADLDQLFNELALVRERGYAIDDEEYYEGVRCIGAPVRSRGHIVASVSITGSIFSMTMKRIEQGLIELVKEAGEGISKELRNAYL